MANLNDLGFVGSTADGHASAASFFSGRILSENWGVGERETLMAATKKKKPAKKKPAKAKPTKRGPGCTTNTATCQAGCKVSDGCRR